MGGSFMSTGDEASVFAVSVEAAQRRRSGGAAVVQRRRSSGTAGRQPVRTVSPSPPLLLRSASTSAPTSSSTRASAWSAAAGPRRRAARTRRRRTVRGPPTAPCLAPRRALLAAAVRRAPRTRTSPLAPLPRPQPAPGAPPPRGAHPAWHALALCTQHALPSPSPHIPAVGSWDPSTKRGSKAAADAEAAEALQRALLSAYAPPEALLAGGAAAAGLPGAAYPAKLAEMLVGAARRLGVPLGSALDVGAGVGAAAFHLAAAGFESVLGVEHDARAVAAAQAAQQAGTVAAARKDEGHLRTPLELAVPGGAAARQRVAFRQMDPCCIGGCAPGWAEGGQEGGAARSQPQPGLGSRGRACGPPPWRASHASPPRHLPPPGPLPLQPPTWARTTPCCSAACWSASRRPRRRWVRGAGHGWGLPARPPGLADPAACHAC